MMRKKVRKAKPKAYRVGKGRPPLETRWRPGESGNPKGRPKGSRNIGAVLNDILKQRIAVTENGRTRKVQMLEAMLRRLVNDALRNPTSPATKLLMSMVDRYTDDPQAELRLEELAAEDQRILARYMGESSAAEPPDDEDEK